MADGNRVPLAHDGMGVFNMPDGRFRLVRNHEDRNGPGAGTTALQAGKSYDIRAAAETTVIVNPFTRQVESEFVSLSGTTVNCAGGVTPWGSWITCEETNVGPANVANPWLKQHGYCFDVPASADGQVEAVAVPDMGRFSHEAVAVDPLTGIVYKTEDLSPNSGLYRFIPNMPGQLVKGGRLQILGVKAIPPMTPARVKLSAWRSTSCGLTSPIRIRQERPLMPCGCRGARQAGAASHGLKDARGATARCTSSTPTAGMPRPDKCGYRPDSDGGTLTLIFESPNAAVLDAPDNLTVSPQEALLLCEDGGGDQYMRGVTLDGAIFDFALNIQNDYEWAGATFAEADPAWNDRKIRGGHHPLGGRWERITLFANRQGATGGSNPPLAGDEGLTFAIWGPWKEGAL